MVDDAAEKAARPGTRTWTTRVLILLALVLGGWFAVRSISAAVCADYDSFSNDFCDKWHYDTPPDNAIPVPTGWRIAWQKLSCGSGGCPRRLYVLVPPVKPPAPVELYLDRIDELGWRGSAYGYDARKGDLIMDVELASNNAGVLQVPAKLAKPGLIYIALGICGEATTCE